MTSPILAKINLFYNGVKRIIEARMLLRQQWRYAASRVVYAHCSGQPPCLRPVGSVTRAADQLVRHYRQAVVAVLRSAAFHGIYITISLGIAFCAEHRLTGVVMWRVRNSSRRWQLSSRLHRHFARTLCLRIKCARELTASSIMRK